MFEAAIQLLDQGDLRGLTTNAVAERAGLSIGTLYQYFGGKEALLDALVQRELGDMSANVMQAVQDKAPSTPAERVHRIVHAVLKSYGGRSRVHRLLIEHAMTQRAGNRLNPLFADLMLLLTSSEKSDDAHMARGLNEAQAFVLVHSISGVLRTYSLVDEPPSQDDLEEALVTLIVSFIGGIRQMG